METSKRRDCDLILSEDLFPRGSMEWRPQKEGIATLLSDIKIILLMSMEWRPQKEGIATSRWKFKLK